MGVFGRGKPRERSRTRATRLYRELVGLSCCSALTFSVWSAGRFQRRGWWARAAGGEGYGRAQRVPTVGGIRVPAAVELFPVFVGEVWFKLAG